MSKVDAQRAMREAKYARIVARGASSREAAAAEGAATAPPAPAPKAKAPRASKAAPATVAPEGGRCGHKSMNGRECTREAGHAAKSHRYS